MPYEALSMLQRLRAWWKEPSHWHGTSYSRLFTQLYFTFELSTQDLELFTGLTMCQWHLDRSHVEWLWQALSPTPKLSHRSCLGMFKIKILVSCSPNNGLPSIVWHVMNSSLLKSPIPPFHASLGMWPLAQTFESLKIGEALSNLSFCSKASHI